MAVDPVTAAHAHAAVPAPDTLTMLAAGTLHDVSNLLVVVLGCAELVLDDPTLGARSRQLVEGVVQVSERAGAIAQQMLAFARGDATAPAGMLDVVTALRAAEPLVRRVAGRSVIITVDAAPEPLWVRAAPVDLERVVVNLVSNSCDAMPDGGRLRLAAVAATAGPGDPLTGPVVRLTVTDTGRGIDPDVRARLFEAFASTRAGDGHWGLGLAVVRAVVERLGGVVRVASAPEEGTTFVIDLPAVAAPVSS